MNKELRELLNLINTKKSDARALIMENKLEDAKALKNEIEELQNKFDLMKDLFEEEQAQVNDKVKDKEKNPKNEYKKEFLNGVRTKFQNGMSEGSKLDGGYTVPQDIQTKINELRESKDSLQTLVRVENVNTLEGSRVFKKRAQQTGFVEVAEGGTITEKATPQFSPMDYKVKKYAGFFKMTNELLQDTDQALESTLIDWIGNESRVTRNKLILEVLAEKEKTAIAGLDDIKKVFNITLDPAFLPTSVIVTNQDGFNWLDTLKDKDDNYVLQPDPTNATVKRLFGRYPITVISNKDLPTEEAKAPMIIGDLKEACVLFDRKSLSIATSNTAADAFLTDVTLFRAIEREQVKMWDEEAFVYGEITLP